MTCQGWVWTTMRVRTPLWGWVLQSLPLHIFLSFIFRILNMFSQWKPADSLVTLVGGGEYHCEIDPETSPELKPTLQGKWCRQSLIVAEGSTFLSLQFIKSFCLYSCQEAGLWENRWEQLQPRMCVGVGGKSYTSRVTLTKVISPKHKSQKILNQTEKLNNCPFMPQLYHHTNRASVYKRTVD